MIAGDHVGRARSVRIEAAIAERHIKLSPGRTERCGPCPRCGGTDRFSINIKKQVFNCRGCGDGGDVIRLVRFLDGSDFPTAVETLAGAPRKPAAGGRGGPGRLTYGAAPQKAASEPDDEAVRIASARRLWAESIPIDGKLAELYLRGPRSLTINEDLSHVIRFHDRTPWFDESSGNTIRVLGMIAAMRSIDGDEIVAIQKTWLAPDGSKLGRKMFGPAKDAAIKIDRDEDVTYGLIVGEGLETCLAARELGFRPCWALGSAGAIGTFSPLPGIDALTILAETGERSAHEVKTCGTRWCDAEREVIAVRPQSGSDINDAIRKVAT